MKTILTATLERDINTDEELYMWTESSECDYARDWDGDVRGYLENADWFDADEMALVPACNCNIDNIPSNDALVIIRNGVPEAMFWAAECSNEADADEA